jgi:hypothetical protein
MIGERVERVPTEVGRSQINILSSTIQLQAGTDRLDDHQSN